MRIVAYIQNIRFVINSMIKVGDLNKRLGAVYCPYGMEEASVHSTRVYQVGWSKLFKSTKSLKGA